MLSPNSSGVIADRVAISSAGELLRGLLLQAFYTARSGRQLMEQLNYNLLFRWFGNRAMDAPIWYVTVFTKNHSCLLAGDIAARFLSAVMG